MQVIATEVGFDGMRIRNPGEVFEMPDDTEIDSKSWFEKVNDKSRAKAAKAATNGGPEGVTGSGTTSVGFPNGGNTSGSAGLV